MKLSLRRARELLDKAPGPAPWYLTWNAPAFDSRFGPLTWATIGGASVLNDPNGKVRLILGMYCYVLALAPGRLLIWHGPRSSTRAASSHVDFHVIETDQLDVIPDPEQSAQTLTRDGLQRIVVSKSDDAQATTSVPAGLPAGTSSIGLPEGLEGLPELLFFLHGESTRLWSVRPAAQLVEVMPQDWFDRGNFDFGYEWPTRAARDAATGSIVGDGIRIGTFVLDETGRNLAAWL